eukprot:124673-Amphidinium_carterae.1
MKVSVVTNFALSGRACVVPKISYVCRARQRARNLRLPRGCAGSETGPRSHQHGVPSNSAQNQLFLI